MLGLSGPLLILSGLLEHQLVTPKNFRKQCGSLFILSVNYRKRLGALTSAVTAEDM